MIWLLACAAGPEDPSAPALRIPVQEARTSGPRTVVWFTIDTLNQDHLGPDSVHPSSPHHEALFEQGVVMPHTVVTRGVTVISLPSIATGTYPRTHGVTEKQIPPPGAMPAMVQELLQDEGFETYVYSANICVMHSRGWTESHCSADSATASTDQARDQLMVDAFLRDLARLPAHQDAFFWIHLRDPHAPYSPREPWISDFYDAPRDGRTTIITDDLDGITLGETEPPDGFEDWLSAVYASQVASSDAMLGQVRDALEGADRLDVIFTGTDHGEELGAHHDYFLHGCSTYEPVINTTWSMRAPELEPSRIEDSVSTTDMLPSLLEILDIPIPESVEGRSLVAAAGGEDDSIVPVFFQKGSGTAGVVEGDRKYFLSKGEQPFCRPFGGDEVWPGPTEGLFDLVQDPDEADNLAETEPNPIEKTTLCGWVVDYDWGDDVAQAQELIDACTEHLAE